MTGPAGGTWQECTTDRAQCAACGNWITRARVWRYWVGLVCHLTVCASCAEDAL